MNTSLKKPKKPNDALRYHREMRGWSQRKVAEELDITEDKVSRWERGIRTTSPYYREKLCILFGKDAEELGFIGARTEFESPSTNTSLKVISSDPIYMQSSTAQMVTPAIETRDWTIWSGLNLARIIRTISLWNGQSGFCDEVQTMVDQELKMFDETLQQNHMQQEEQKISRRTALITIAALPTTLFGIAKQPGIMTDLFAEEFLPQCAASVTACWHLLKGKGLAAVDEIFPKFVPLLGTLALRPSKYQKVAARLAAQTSIIQGISAMHRLNFAAREAHCNDAIRYASISQDVKLQAASFMYLGYTYSHCYYPRKPQKAIPIFHQALHALGNEMSLLRSDILMGMGEAYAQCKEEQEALRYIGLAQEHFPTYPEHDPSFIYADCGVNTLYQWQGKTYLRLVEHFPNANYQQKAADSLIQSIGINSISERSKNETIIYQADASRVMGELEIYASSLKYATQMAVDIGSQRRYNDALLVYQQTPEKWINEPQIQELARNVFKQLPTRKVG